MKDFLERDMPVTVDTQMQGWGHFTTRIDWLKTWVKVEWRGRIWCISREGKMWLYEQGSPSDAETGKLVWKLPEEGNITEGENIQPPMHGVFNSPISTEVIDLFLEEFRGCNWFDAATELRWERRAGLDLFVLKLEHGRQKFELYLQRDKYEGQDVGAAIDDLFAKLINEGGNHVIDATYAGKIRLRKM